jgi:putative ABC transport system ATP-binding protein
VTPTNPAVLACEDLVHVYVTASGGVHALRGVTASFAKGTVSAVVGASGCGKSTLLRLLACMEPATAGELWVDGRATSRMGDVERRKTAGAHVGFVFQRPSLNLISYLTVEEHLFFALQSSGHGKRGAAAALENSQLAGLRHRKPATLDAGERQRLAVAMAVASARSVVIADEPSAELDTAGGSSLAQFIRTAADQGQTFVIATHDPQLMAIADELLVMKDGCLAQIGPPNDLHYVVSSTGGLYLDADAQKLFPAGRAIASIDETGVRFTPT